MRSGSYDPLDPRLALRAYALVAGATGFALVTWGQLWFGSNWGVFPWDQAVLIRMSGAIVIAAALCAWGMASGDAASSRRTLPWFIGAHAVVWLMLVAQISAIAGPPGLIDDQPARAACAR